MNRFLSSLGLPTGTFFDEASSSMATFIWTTTWSAGGSMVIWLAAFKNVPTQLYEAATLDGADYMQKVFYVTIPMSTPMIFYNLINGIIGSLQMFNTFIVASNTGGRGIDNSLYMVRGQNLQNGVRRNEYATRLCLGGRHRAVCNHSHSDRGGFYDEQMGTLFGGRLI